MMKLFVAYHWPLAILVGILLPLPGLSHSVQTATSASSPDSQLLVQTVDYYGLAQQSRQEQQLTVQEVTRFEAIAQQVHRETNRSRLLKLHDLARKSAERAANHYQRSGTLGLHSLPYYRADPYAQSTLDTVYRIELELAQVFRGYGQLYQQSSRAVQTGNIARLDILATKFKMLDEQEARFLQMTQQLAQAYSNRSAAVNAQSINNAYSRMGEGITQRGRATKCMVSSLPYGSPAQIANNASGYCNSP